MTDHILFVPLLLLILTLVIANSAMLLWLATRVQTARGAIQDAIDLKLIETLDEPTDPY